MTWDNEGRLTAWQNAPTAPTSTDQRIEQQVTSSGATSMTTYVAGGLEEIGDAGTNTALTTHFAAEIG